MPSRPGGIPILLQIAGGAACALLCAATVGFFANMFSRGATLSGLNPDGGGPGFLLLGFACLFGYFTRPPVESILSVAGHAVLGLAYGLYTGVLFLVLLHTTGMTSEIAVHQLVSGIVIASLVPRVIVPVLSWAWSETERSVSSHSPGG